MLKNLVLSVIVIIVGINKATKSFHVFNLIPQFGALTPLEPRLGKKLIEPLTNLIHRYWLMLLFSANILVF